MRALGWDDKPFDYFDDLKQHLSDYGIELIIETDPNKVPARIENEQWDFIITDILDEVQGVEQELDPIGIQIANKVLGKDLPLYVVTHTPNHEYVRKQIKIEAPILSKMTLPGFAADAIVQDLKRRGAWINKKKVFLIYGHNRQSADASERVEAQLIKWKLEIGKISGERMSGEIIVDLLKEMQESAAIIAVCTPDDLTIPISNKELDDNNIKKKDLINQSYRQPRQNVLLEIGMAMGLNRGLNKLTFIQRWGEEKKSKAILPSDLGSVLTIRFEGKVNEIFPDLKDRLRRLNVSMINSED